jgi:RNA 2',3'-cyclic 3'-phosphodiesterase
VDEFPAEKRPFHPHLTVARSDPPLKLPVGYSGTELDSKEWDVDHVVLFRSHLGRPAPRYEALSRFALGG